MLLFSHKRESGELYSTHCLSFIYYYVVIVLLATNFNRNHNQFHFIPRKISSYMAYICILFFYSNTITSIYTWIIKKEFVWIIATHSKLFVSDSNWFYFISFLILLFLAVKIIRYNNFGIKNVYGVEQCGKWNKN